MSNDNEQTRIELVRSDDEEKYLVQKPGEIRQILTGTSTGVR